MLSCYGTIWRKYPVVVDTSLKFESDFCWRASQRGNYIHGVYFSTFYLHYFCILSLYAEMPQPRDRRLSWTEGWPTQTPWYICLVIPDGHLKLEFVWLIRMWTASTSCFFLSFRGQRCLKHHSDWRITPQPGCWVTPCGECAADIKLPSHLTDRLMFADRCLKRLREEKMPTVPPWSWTHLNSIRDGNCAHHPWEMLWTLWTSGLLEAVIQRFMGHRWDVSISFGSTP